MTLSAGTLSAEAATISWTGASDNNWFNSLNWSPAQVPTSADNAIIDLNTTVSVAGGTSVSFAALSLGDAAANFSPTLLLSAAENTNGSITIYPRAKLQQDTVQRSTFGAVTVMPGGMLTHTANSTARSFLINLNVTGNFDLQAGATIALNGLGYMGGIGPQADPKNGAGPGAGSYDGTGSGAGHGGAGGRSSSGLAGGGSYDSATNPTDLGSGGGAAITAPGGAGGGAAMITVGGTFFLNGLIDARGVDGATSINAFGSGGGAGGTVNLTAATFSGTGMVLADGGVGGPGSSGRGGGGGGGILAFAGCSSTTLSIGVSGGLSGGAGATSGNVGALLQSSPPNCPFPPIIPTGFAITAVEARSIAASWNPVATASSYLLQASTNAVFAGVVSSNTAATSALLAGLLPNNIYFVRVQAANAFGNSAFTSAVSTLTPTLVDDADDLIVPAGFTHTLAGTRSYNNSVVIDGTLLVSSVSGALELSAPIVRINAGGVLSADGAGFGAEAGPGRGEAGGGNQFNNFGGGGGGYGGFGGLGRGLRLGGAGYGALTQLQESGSGGGSAGGVGGAGGGRIKITAGTLLLDGRISANGRNGGEAPPEATFKIPSGGGGSGGAIMISASSLQGAGIIAANGGDSPAQYGAGGGGGGGRVAVTYGSTGFTGPITAIGGSGFQAGGAGTVVYGGELRIENAVQGASTTIPSGTYSFDSMRVATHAVVELTSAAAVTATTLVVQGSNLLNLFTGSLDVQQATLLPGARLRYAGGRFTATDMSVSTAVVFTLNRNLSLSQLSVLGGGLITHDLGVAGFDLSISGNLTVAVGGAISGNAVGHPSLQGVGAGYLVNAGQFDDQGGGGGGGYGGLGGAADRFHAVSGAAYGSLTTPTDLGSGGGTANGNAGGAGGGRLRISVGTLQLDGRISANGGNGSDSPPSSTFKIGGGGGAGGTVWISAGSIQGTGTVSADGGNSVSTGRVGGGGGGGRVVVTYGSNAFSGVVTAYGGSGIQSGGAGSVVYGAELRIINLVQGASTTIPSGTYSFDSVRMGTGAVVELTPTAALTAASLVLQNSGLIRHYTGTLNVPQIELQSGASFRYYGGALTITDFVISSASVLALNTAMRATNVTVRSGGLITHDLLNAAFDLAVSGTLTLEPGGRISVDGAGFISMIGAGSGYANNAGPFDGNGGGGGAGYGGLGGGADSSRPTSGSVYGSITQPLELGSGGGTGNGNAGGAGGGRLKIGAGTLVLNGTISANGRNGSDAPPRSTFKVAGGGGSGGAILITVGSIQGLGAISANGGASISQGRSGGGGGGGRIALYYGTRSGAWTTAVSGGLGRFNGKPGTILDNAQLVGFDATASSATVAASQMTQRLESTQSLSETVAAQLMSYAGAVATGTAAGNFSQADIRLVLVKTGSYAERGFFRGNWKLDLSAITSLSGEWEGMAYLALDEPRRLILKGVMKGQVRGVIDGTLTESSLGSGVFDRLSIACRVVQVDAAAGVGDMYINGSGQQTDSAQYPGTSLTVLQTSQSGQASGYYSTALDVTFTFLRVNQPGHPYQGEGFFVTSYNSSLGSGNGWAYAVAYDQAARLGGFLDLALRGLMEGAMTLASPRALLLTLQNLDAGQAFEPQLAVDWEGPNAVDPGTTATFSITLRNDGYAVAPGISVVAVYPENSDFVSASDNYVLYNIANWPQGVLIHKPFVRWDFVEVPARSVIRRYYQGFIRFPSPGAPSAGTSLGGEVQLVTKSWADQVFSGYPINGAP